ncbi:MAG: Exodeoxyribonuclease 7 large subunit [Firmicutes bacterium ADurb.Bin300]|nr:MAG: Exodeoxyribonuclease 7 large subunit [Firmicutes bacterium ADurb.Bin300]
MYTPTPTVLTVTQLNNYVKKLIENDEYLNVFFLSGEISNFKRHTSGHLYMSLKDSTGVIRAVMFAQAAARLRFRPEDGMKVIIRGRASIYTKDGSFQVYIDDMQPDGLGSLNLAFEQLKEKLRKEGLFDVSKKKTLPRLPNKIGVITSPTGAAVRDILSVLKRRYPVAEVVFCPTAVQGKGAAAEIAAAIDLFNKRRAAQLLIVGRGGGSLEELWAFNEEVLARAVALSEIPIISAVGHETDFTICDLAADFRAPTPSAAAEIAVPDIVELKALLNADKEYIFSLLKDRIHRKREQLNSLMKCRVLQNPMVLTDEVRQRADRLSQNMIFLIETRFFSERERLKGTCGKLSALSPLEVLSRGYSIVYDKGAIITDAEALSESSEITVRFNKGSARAIVKEINNENQ